MLGTFTYLMASGEQPKICVEAELVNVVTRKTRKKEKKMYRETYLMPELGNNRDKIEGGGGISREQGGIHVLEGARMVTKHGGGGGGGEK